MHFGVRKHSLRFGKHKCFLHLGVRKHSLRFGKHKCFLHFGVRKHSLRFGERKCFLHFGVRTPRLRLLLIRYRTRKAAAMLPHSKACVLLDWPDVCYNDRPWQPKQRHNRKHRPSAAWRVPPCW